MTDQELIAGIKRMLGNWQGGHRNTFRTVQDIHRLVQAQGIEVPTYAEYEPPVQVVFGLTAEQAVRNAMMDFDPVLDGPGYFIKALGYLGYTVTPIEQLIPETVDVNAMPAPSWEIFLRRALAVFLAKDRDYDSRFMRAMIQHKKDRGLDASRAVWAWEVEKKLDRIRSWIERGELAVKGEGVADSVVDLFNYTVQYVMFVTTLRVGIDPLDFIREEGKPIAFMGQHSALEWVNFLQTEGLIKPEEDEVRKTILHYMGVRNEL